MGIINMMIVLPMLIQTLTFGYIYKNWLGHKPGNAITFAGVFFGWLLAANLGKIIPLIERAFNVEFLPKSIYFISELPSDPRLDDIITIVIVALSLSVISTIYPSWRAARAEPAEALRYE